MNTKYGTLKRVEFVFGILFKLLIYDGWLGYKRAFRRFI